ncbi:hypothetical protein ACR79S_17110 [Sphingobacterium spiritivorum]|uniref:DUF4328 domain-containing protein n=1 Tax=Sphingobacterium spiritivorum ATCC 33861 TaxID=525373 RepID=D7VIX4_SPHSI|nr:hypothetical protein [Sphingobacterium spiritivorum]EFK60026.1 hypothetical protein HMPREF0766_10943 [Sphingobacterium spiritivorum ATCC 33861]QQT37348.1 hypothetical protein I6J01_08085 [Sphingobacterium spiritivorum]WQD34138.1 hypothetical protein U0038_00020 [Sphingobacterium spiritivorum]SUJ29869.1 Uncharacterised protein [Sphingobacterium spiritivorum]
MLEFTPDKMTMEMLYIILAASAVRLICWILFANTIRKTLNLIAPENRNILPSQAWFVAVPLFNIYWHFEVARRLCDSLNNEFYDRKIAVEENPTRKEGQIYAWTFLSINIPFPPFILVIAGIMNLIYFITYWVKINQYRVLLKEHNKFVEKEVNEG